MTVRRRARLVGDPAVRAALVADEQRLLDYAERVEATDDAARIAARIQALVAGRPVRYRRWELPARARPDLPPDTDIELGADNVVRPVNAPEER